MNGMILIVHETDLANLIQDLPGWSNLQVRFLNTRADGRYYNVHLTKKQVAVLGASKIKATYQATEIEMQRRAAVADTQPEYPVGTIKRDKNGAWWKLAENGKWKKIRKLRSFMVGAEKHWWERTR